MKRGLLIAVFSLMFVGLSTVSVRIAIAHPADDQAVPRLRLGGSAMRDKLQKKIPPVYPVEARKNGIEGTVRLHLIVGVDGNVRQLEVMSGHPLLVQAALDAVRQWQYEPTQFKGKPAEVDTTVDVIFQLHK
jgi:periplasmic protein TonB